MPLLNVVFALIVVGVALWLINRFIPMASSIKTILNVVVVVAVGVWVNCRQWDCGDRSPVFALADDSRNQVSDRVRNLPSRMQVSRLRSSPRHQGRLISL